MTLCTLTEALRAAVAAGSGLGAFNVFSLEHAEAIVAGAETAGLPWCCRSPRTRSAITGPSDRSVSPHWLLATASSVPAVVHLDHATEQSSGAAGRRAWVRLGDVRRLAAALRARIWRPLPRSPTRCHAAGVDVEAELGEVGGKDGVHAPGARTRLRRGGRVRRGHRRRRAGRRRRVVARDDRGHGRRSTSTDRGDPRGRTDVPLVLHGSSGVPDDESGPGRPGRDDQDQHRHPAEQVPSPRALRIALAARPAAGRHPEVSRARPRRRRRRGRPGCSGCSPFGRPTTPAGRRSA